MTYHEQVQLTGLMRGVIINEVIFLERLMDIYIAQYFCDNLNKRHELQVTFLGNERTTYAAKKQIFYLLLKKLNPEIINEKPKIDKELDDIGEQRNFFAHCLMDNTIDYSKSDPSTVYLLRFKDKTKRETYTKERFNKVLGDIDTMIKLIQPLLTQYEPPQNSEPSTV
jgi:hypothetical protein